MVQEEPWISDDNVNDGENLSSATALGNEDWDSCSNFCQQVPEDKNENESDVEKNTEKRNS